MGEFPRRRLLQNLAAFGAALAAAPRVGSTPDPAQNLLEPCGLVPLNGPWMFRIDRNSAGESQGWHRVAAGADGWTAVTVPHTWQTSEEWSAYQGNAWYRRTFKAPEDWAARFVRVEFEAVSHSVNVWLNGARLGEHLRKGYTAFTLDATPALRAGRDNTLVVRVDNSFYEDMLPRGKSFDWTLDGGIVRPVNLLVTPRIFIERIGIDAQPNLETKRTEVRTNVTLRNARQDAAALRVSCRVLEDDSGRPVAAFSGPSTMTLKPGATETILLTSPPLDLQLWHFDRPTLYQLVVDIEQGGKPIHSSTETFGVRKFEVRDGGFHLNGERVRLMGVERMAGSNPDYGMAEPSSWIEHDHNDLKELDCVFTRAHWPQDKRVLDFCDRHGILFQEEVPAWGPGTFQGMKEEPSPEIMQNGLEQLREMIERDRNHPSVVAWGLCNEVNGQNPVAQKFIRRMAEEARKLDPTRPLTYASHSLYDAPERDVAGELDFISWNEYYGSWRKGDADSVRGNLQAIQQAFPSKPIVISEFGYCECTPDRTGGDARRIEILREHTKVFRDFDRVAGAIFFDYNDYRTHLGDKGANALQQRVHGVVDLLGNRKPSFDALREEVSPFSEFRVSIDGRWITTSLLVQQTLPAYTVEGYSLRAIVYGYGDLPVEQYFVPLPKMAPGEGVIQEVAFEEKAPRRIRVDLLRPTGISAATVWWKP
ncbi:MAG: beta galactosidase jelly roll domain-containing protein [Acidobacteriia bacterium]|nr:beta galactosidase jelly roll domain-containing protein [Terriglobia bacterium]